MKKTFYIFLCLVAMIFSGCRVDKNIDPTIMPAITNTGENTFGCLVNGWVTVGGRYYDVWTLWGDTRSIAFDYYESSNYVDVCVKIDETPDQYLKFRINNVATDVFLPHNCTFENAILSDSRYSGSEILIENSGNVTITTFNDADSIKIISGIFYGNKITEGRFDVHYRDK